MKNLAFRLKPGDLLIEEIEKRVQNIKAGVLLSVVGSLENVNLRLAGANQDVQIEKNYSGPFEIVSGTGTISPDGCHIHISVSNKEGKVSGGHLKDGCKIATTAEIIIGVLDKVSFRRINDSETGFKELVIE